MNNLVAREWLDSLCLVHMEKLIKSKGFVGLTLVVAVFLMVAGVYRDIRAEEAVNSRDPQRVEVRKRNVEQREVQKRDQQKKVRAEAKDTREADREKVQATREETRAKTQGVRENVRVDREAVRTDFQNKKEELRTQILEKREETKVRFEASRDEAKKRLETAREEFKKKLEQIRDERKKQTAVRLEEQVNRQNERWTAHFVNVLERLEEVLGKIEVRADKAVSLGKDVSAVKTALQEAENAIMSAHSAVEAQAKKVYTIQITKEQEMRSAFQATKEQLKRDLAGLRDGAMKTAREAVRKVFEALARVPKVDEQLDEAPVNGATSAEPAE